MGFREELESGREAFGHLIRVWHERNGWSQRVLPALAERLDLGRVHNSQLSMLRNHKLLSPGPELFLTLGRLNGLLAEQGGGNGHGPGIGAALASQLQDQAELLVPLQASALALRADTGQPLGPFDPPSGSTVAQGCRSTLRYVCTCCKTMGRTTRLWRSPAASRPAKATAMTGGNRFAILVLDVCMHSFHSSLIVLRGLVT